MEKKIRDLLSDLNDTKSSAIFRTIKLGGEWHEFDTGKGDVFFTYGEREDKCMIIFKLSDGIESKINSIDIASTIFMD